MFDDQLLQKLELSSFQGPFFMVLNVFDIRFSAQGLRPDFRLLLGSNGRFSLVALQSTALGRQPHRQLVVVIAQHASDFCLFVDSSELCIFVRPIRAPETGLG